MLESARLSGYLHFFRAGVVNHLQTGAFFPSQRILVEAMIAPVPIDYQGQIVELGPGNGTLTVRLAKRCRQAGIVACELDPTLAEDTRQTLDRWGINGRTVPILRNLPPVFVYYAEK